MPTAKEVQRELNRREWEKRIAECESSNMSVREWCDANGINVNTYYGRVSALKKDKPKQKKQSVQEIVPLSTVQEQPDAASTVIIEPTAVTLQRNTVHAKEKVIIRKDGIEIVIPPDISSDMLVLLLRGLKEC